MILGVSSCRPNLRLLFSKFEWVNLGWNSPGWKQITRWMGTCDLEMSIPRTTSGNLRKMSFFYAFIGDLSIPIASFPASWFIESLVRWFIESLVHWFTDSLVHLLTNSHIHWFTGSLIWFSDSLVYWFVGSLIHWFTHELIHRIIGSLIRSITDSLNHRTTNAFIHWFIGSSAH